MKSNNELIDYNTEDYEKQLEEFLKYINKMKNANSRVIYTNEINERINTLYKLGVKPGTIKEIISCSLYYCGKTAIVIDNKNIFRPLLDWIPNGEYDSKILKDIICWLSSDDNLEGLDIFELMTDIIEILDTANEKWSHYITYNIAPGENERLHTPTVFAVTSLPHDVGVVLLVGINYDVNEKNYILDIDLAYTNDRYDVYSVQFNNFKVKNNKEGFEEFKLKFNEILKTYKEINPF